jgi:fatty-acyl-CoA synthase
VVTHHRGAYLNAASNAHFMAACRTMRSYLWTLPMFHCNGWCFPWTMALIAGTSVCLRRVDPALIYPLIRQHHITHMCGAPIVYSMLIHASVDALREGIEPHRATG